MNIDERIEKLKKRNEFMFDKDILFCIHVLESLDKAISEIRYGENKAYNADFTMGCEYAISVIERAFEEGGKIDG